MAVSEEFREQWLECEEEFGKNIEAGDMPVIGYGEVDETISLPAVKFTAPFDPEGTNVFDSYAHVPMKTFKKRIDDLAGEVSEATSDLQKVKQDAIAATDDAIEATENAEAATTAATNVNADLTGMTVTITNRQGVSKSVNIGFEILQEHVYPSVAAMNADAANVRAGQFCMIATTDPTSPDNAQLWSRNSSPASSDNPFTFLSDLDQASSAAFADWLNNYKPVIEADHQTATQDHQQADSDHETALSDHATATSDHTRSGQDHQTATQDHQQADSDHETTLSDHATATSDHTRAGQDHQTATQDHQQADGDHSRAETDHSTASSDHTQAGQDHTRAEQDHQTATQDHQQADSDHETATQDHQQADSDHETALSDHATATSDHTRSGQDHQTATQDHQQADGDHSRAETDHQTASQDHQQYLSDTDRSSQDHATATTDHQASVAATTAATNVNADLTGMTVTITNRQGVSKSVNIGFEILQEHVYPSVAAMNADAANVRAGQFCMIATTDPTSPDNAQLWSRNSSAATSEHPFTFLSDLDQASSAAFADWLDNYKPVIEADHSRAEADHTRAEQDHTTATTDHATATTDHQTATQDHQTATSDHRISAEQQATFETNEAARQQTFDTNEAQRQADFENAEEDRIAAMTVTRCFVRLQNMHLIFVQPESDSTQYKVRRGRLKIITTYNT